MEESLDDLYSAIHTSLHRVIDVTNLSIARYDQSTNMIPFAYFVDEYGDYLDIPQVDLDEKSLTNAVFRERKTIVYNKEELEEKAAQKMLIGSQPFIWVGVPLMIKEKMIGIMIT